MLDSTNLTTDRPPRRSALIAQELSRYQIDIAALSETRLAGEGSVTEDGAGYTFFWKGYGENEHRIHGVGFAIKSRLIDSLEDTPTGISPRQMRMRIPITRGRYATLLSCYAPTLDSSEEEKDSFYECLDGELRRIPPADKIILLGDFNARVGTTYIAWRGVLGRNGLGKKNSNGHRLLSLCARYGLTITNTIFDQKDIYKGTWMHPRSRHWHLIDYVITRQRDLRDVCITRAMRGADCWTDHRLVRSRFLLHIRPPTRRRPPNKRLNCASLASEEIRASYQEAVTAKLTAAPRSVDGDVEADWQKFSAAVKDATEEAIGFSSRKNQDWFDQNSSAIKQMIDRKHKCHAAHINSPSSQFLHDAWREARSECQRELRRMENDWWMEKAGELQRFADSNDQQNFYSSLKQVYGPTSRSLAPVRSGDGVTLYRNKIDIVKRWEEHYRTLPNTENETDFTIIDSIPQHREVQELDVPPSLEEVRAAMKSLKNGKSPGKDSIPGEVLRCGGDEVLHRLHHLILDVWETEEVPQAWKDARIVSIHKKRGDKAECGNSRGISLLSISGKVLARVLLARLKRHIVDDVCPESQCGFRGERGTIDMIFVSRQLQEKCREQHRNLCMAFIDLTKAFDTVNRNMLWCVLRKFGCTRKFVAVTRAFHDDMTASVVIGGEETGTFSVGVGVKQGCVIAPIIFNIYLAAVTILFKREVAAGSGVTIDHRLDGSVFDLRRLQARTKVRTSTLHELQYADDCVLLAHEPRQLQEALDLLSNIYRDMGLIVNTDKTEILCQ